MIAKRIKIALSIVIIIGLLVCFRLWQLQILNGSSYRAQSESNRLRIIKTPAPRGIIYDRNGIPLVKNIPVFSVAISPDNLKGIDRDKLAALLGLTREEIDEKLDSKDISPFIPIKLKEGLGFEETARIEARKSDFNGLFIETEVGREYLNGKVGAHFLGYLGRITPKQKDDPNLQDFPPDALIGQWGIEALYDNKLHGKPGERIIEVDAMGRELRLIQEKPALKGEDITLSIDINIQKAVEDAFGKKAGALVAIKPATGEILALESLPSFDPNGFSRGIVPGYWKELIEDSKKPMLNRALQSQYPPGSTFKIITAIAALEEGVATPDTKVTCTGGLGYGRWTFGCWKKGGHGVVDLHRALVESCDVYFYEMGKRLGVDKIHKWATAFGLGEVTGVVLRPVTERKGLIPSTAWKREKRHDQWYLGETYNSAIGQGYVTVTPIQMARMLAAVTNGGYVYTPTFLKDAKQDPRTVVKLKPETVEFIKDALGGVVNEPGGTARVVQSQLVRIGGKTGTAQVVSKGKSGGGEKFMDHAWFVAFAPVENPEIALAVFVEHGGHGGSAAGPPAKKAIEAYLQSKQNGSGNMLPQAEMAHAAH